MEYGHGDSGPSGLGPLGMHVHVASLDALATWRGEAGRFTVSEASPQYRRSAYYQRSLGCCISAQRARRTEGSRHGL